MELKNKNETVAPDRRPESEYPFWRKEFPIDQDAESNRNRRHFFGAAVVAGGALACGQLVSNKLGPQESLAESPDEPLNLEKNFNDLDDGEAILFHYPNHRSPCLFIRLSESSYVAYLQKCTHLACPVIPHAHENELHCPCHHGTFDLATGEPIAGPPREPLPKVPVAVSETGTITVG